MTFMRIHRGTYAFCFGQSFKSEDKGAKTGFRNVNMRDVGFDFQVRLDINKTETVNNARIVDLLVVLKFQRRENRCQLSSCRC